MILYGSHAIGQKVIGKIVWVNCKVLQYPLNF